MKEVLQVNVRCFLLIVLMVSSPVLRAQAYYHPDEGRWISRDPIGEKEKHLYLFALNSPCNYADKLGMFSIKLDQPRSFKILPCGGYDYLRPILIIPDANEAYNLNDNVWVLQRIDMEAVEMDCQNNIIKVDKISFWEAWPNKLTEEVKNAVWINNDNWYESSHPFCTKGYSITKSAAYFFNSDVLGGDPAPSPWRYYDVGHPAGETAHLNIPPGLPNDIDLASADAGPLNEEVSITWNCCPMY